MRVLICGGRDFSDSALMNDVLSKFNISTVIHGAARVADLMAAEWAFSRGIKTESYPAKWNEYGRSAGPIRNKQMLDEGKPDFVIAFPGGAGTQNMINQSKNHGVSVYAV